VKKKKLKIAIFHLAFFYSGGGEKLILEEMKELKRRAYKVDCFSPVVERKQCFPDIIGKFNVRQLFPRFPRAIRHQETLEIILTCLFFPLIASRFRKYDVILGANQPGPWFAWIVKKLYGVPYIIYLAQPTRILYPRKIDDKEGLWLKDRARLFPLLVKLTKPFIKWADKVSIKEADRMLVNGKYMAEILEKTYEKKPVVCPAGANLTKKLVNNRWHGTIKSNGFVIRKPYILLTNRHFPHKKFEYAIKAMSEIIKKVSSASLIITGNPTEYTQELKKLANKFSLQKKIVFTGFITEKDLTKLYANAAVYVYTSPEEDFGMGVIEAMAAGVPVVAWNKAGPSTTVVNGQTGFLIKPYSQSQFTKKIVYLLKKKEENISMGKKAVTHIRKNYTYRKHNDILETELIKTVSMKT